MFLLKKEVRVNYKHTVEVHPALSCVSYKQIYIDGQLVEETELNRGHITNNRKGKRYANRKIFV